MANGSNRTSPELEEIQAKFVELIALQNAEMTELNTTLESKATETSFRAAMEILENIERPRRRPVVFPAIVKILATLLALLTISSHQGLAKAPGAASEKVLRFVFPRKAFGEIFAQAIADMRDEYIEALAAKRKWHARWINVRGHIGLALTVAAYIATTVGKKVAQIWKLGS